MVKINIDKLKTNVKSSFKGKVNLKKPSFKGKVNLKKPSFKTSYQPSDTKIQVQYRPEETKTNILTGRYEHKKKSFNLLRGD